MEQRRIHTGANALLYATQTKPHDARESHMPGKNLERLKRRLGDEAAAIHRLAAFYKDELPRCGARCRDGHPCQAPAAWDEDRCAPRNGRCRLHGGLSTGPRTAAGKRRVGNAARQRARARRQGGRQEPKATR